MLGIRSVQAMVGLWKTEVRGWWLVRSRRLWTAGMLMRIRQGILRGKIALDDQGVEGFEVGSEGRGRYEAVERLYGGSGLSGWACARYLDRVALRLRRHGVDVLEDTVRVLTEE